MCYTNASVSWSFIKKEQKLNSVFTFLEALTKRLEIFGVEEEIS